MHAPKSILLSDANEIRGRTDDYFLSMRERIMRSSVERKLSQSSYTLFSFLTSLAMLMYFSSLCAFAASEEFRIVIFICVWKRPLLTDFVLQHFTNLAESLRVDDIQLDLFLTGSDESETRSAAEKYNAGYSIFPNSPLGAKHDKGIQSLREFYKNKSIHQAESLPDAVTIFGSDDVVNKAFFVHVRDLLKSTPGVHVVGLEDLYFQDLKSNRLVYTRGYKSFQVPISGTLGCGRVYSWAILEELDWHLWDTERERGLDQSAVRNVMNRFPLIGEVSVAVFGAKRGIVAVDIKSDGYNSGTNIWRFDQVIQAVGKNGRLHNFEEKNTDIVLRNAFGGDFISNLDQLRSQMTQHKLLEHLSSSLG